jgi:hypothetical protein
LSDWIIEIPTAVKKKVRQLPSACVKSLELLLLEMRKEGPYRANWPHYGPLSKKKKEIPERAYHCHIKSGKPTYVACWSVVDKKIKRVEIFYVGTHENAPY